MNENYPVFWTERASENILEIRKYILEHHSYSGVDKFEQQLMNFEKTVSHFPEIYPSSTRHPIFRKAVIHKYSSIIYTFRNNKIVVLTVFDNRTNILF